METYFADVPLSPPFQRPTLPPQFFDLQSFQVLKGPQGTLVGRSTTGGAVLIVPAAPSTDGVKGCALAGRHSRERSGRAAVNLPLGEKAALRLAGFAWHREGYNTTIGGAKDPFGKVLPSQYIDNQDVFEERASVLLAPTDSMINTTLFTYHTDKNLCSMTTVSLRGGVFGLRGDPMRPVEPSNAGIGLPMTGPHLLDSDVDLLARGWSSTWAVINTTTLDLADHLKLKSILGQSMPATIPTAHSTAMVHG